MHVVIPTAYWTSVPSNIFTGRLYLYTCTSNFCNHPDYLFLFLKWGEKPLRTVELLIDVLREVLVLFGRRATVSVDIPLAIR